MKPVAPDHEPPLMPENAPEGELSTLDINEEAMQETADPHEAFDPGPWFFYFISLVAVVVASFYLGRHYGDFSALPHLGYQPPAALATSKAPASKAQVSGAAVFTSRCASCHQADGKGVPGAFPPLVASPYVLGEPEVLVKIVLFGLSGEIEVEGARYNGVMPAWASQLNDEEIAAVASHVRGGLGDNKGDSVPVELVTRIRQENSQRSTPWQPKELKNKQ
ncbi:MAG TPA: c-type cytochrome [Methylovorus sp.]|jgi:mono/diheme cytochrome c family protein|nr:c-type cytochrome [Methylovorus sp.]